MIIKYQTSVYTHAGWREVTIKALAKKISPKMASVSRVYRIDGEKPTGYISRTGAKRQEYHAAGIAKRELGKRKRLSSCQCLYQKKEHNHA